MKSSKEEAPDPLPQDAGQMGAATLLAAGTLVSRILGFGRDMLFAALLGPGADAFLVAFRLPNCMRRLLAEGSLGLAYGAGAGIVMVNKGVYAARHAARASAFALFAFSLPAAGLLALLAYPFSLCMAPGLGENTLHRSADLLRLCLPYIPLCLFSAIAFSHASIEGNFRPQAWAPALWNSIVVLAGCIALGMVPFQSGAAFTEYLLCAGVVMGGLLQALQALRCLYPDTAGVRSSQKAGRYGTFRLITMAKGVLKSPRNIFRGGPPRSLKNEAASSTMHFLRRFPQTLVGAAPHQLHILAGTVMASFLFPGAISSLYFAERLVEFPLGMAGASFGIASLPLLASLSSKGALDELADVLRRDILRTAFFSLPAMAGLFALSDSFTIAFFGHGAATSESVMATAAAMRGYAFAIPALCATRPILAALHCLGREKDAVRSAVLSLLPVVLFSVAGQFVMDSNGAVSQLSVLCIALGISAGAWCNALLLLSYLKKAGANVTLQQQILPLVRYVAAALVLALLLSAFCALRGYPGVIGTLLLVAGSGFCWILFFRLFGSKEVDDFLAIFRKKP